MIGLTDLSINERQRLEALAQAMRLAELRGHGGTLANSDFVAYAAEKFLAFLQGGQDAEGR